MTAKTVPPCQAACPVHTDVRGYVTAISSGDLETAIRINRQVNPFPFTCGRVCARPCESVCRRAQVDEPIAIAALKRFAADNTRGINLFQKPESLYSEKVAVIGSGPAGLAAAHDLALLGYSVTVFEAQNIVGGMLREGIPELMEFSIVRDEIPHFSECCSTGFFRSVNVVFSCCQHRYTTESFCQPHIVESTDAPGLTVE